MAPNPVDKRVLMAAGHHQAHKDLIECPPSAVQFELVRAAFQEGESFSYSSGARLRRRVRWHLTRSPMVARFQQKRKVRRLRAQVTAMTRREPDLVHCCGQLYKGGPWVGDYEHVGKLHYFQPNLLADPRYLHFIRRSLADEACRGVRVWSESAARSFGGVMPEVADKIDVIYPALCASSIDALLRTPRKRGPSPRLLFIGRSFLWKGGRQTLMALENLRRRHVAFECDMISDIPPEFADLCRRLDGQVRFHPCLFDRAELFARFYRHADVFVLPTLGDTFGYAFAEAMTFGLPVVGARTYSAVTELVPEQAGALVEPHRQLFSADYQYRTDADQFSREVAGDEPGEFVERLTDALEALVEDPGRRADMSSFNLERTRTGELSARERNARFANFYSRALER